MHSTSLAPWRPNRFGRPGDQARGRPPGGRPGRRRGAVRQPPRPRQGAGPRRPSRGQPPGADLERRPRREVERLALAAQQPRQRPRGDRGGPQPDRRGAGRPQRPRQVPGRHHAVLHLADRPRRSRRPDPPPGDPARAGAAGVHRDDGGLARRGPPLPGARPRASLPRPGADARHDPVRVVLPLLHAVADRRRPDPELQSQGPRGPARLPPPHPAGPRRPDQRRRRPDARPEALRVDPARPPRDPPHRDHPDRLARAGVPAAAHRRRAVRDARAVPPALDQPPLQPPQRDHARGLAGGRQADEGRAAGRQPERPARRRQRLRPHPAGARPPARREPDPAVLPLPVRPRRGLRPLPDAGRQGPRDHGGAARPHERATRCRRT